MPGASCTIVGCGACNGRHKGLSFFSIRQPKHPDWEQALVNAVNRRDSGFNKDKAKICSRHFAADCIITSSAGRRTLLPGSLPTFWMPQEAVDSPEPTPEKPLMDRAGAESPTVVAYFSFEEVRRTLSHLPSPWISISNTEDEIVIGVVEGSMLKFKVHVKHDFSATVYVFGFAAKTQATTIHTLDFSSFLTRILSMLLCPGVCDPSLQEFAELPTGDNKQSYFRHIICMSVSDSVTHTSTVRSKDCSMLVASSELCENCKHVEKLLRKTQERAIAHQTNPTKMNISLLLPNKN